MRILFLRSNAINPDSRVEKEANTLQKAGHEVTIFGWDRNETHKIKRTKLKSNNNINMYLVGIESSFGGGMKRNLFSFLKFEKSLWDFLKEKARDFDVIHACDFDTGFIASNFIKKTNHILVYDIFDYYTHSHYVPKPFERIVENMEINVINRANATIICTEKRRDQIVKSDPNKLTVIHNSPGRIEKFTKVSLNEDKVKVVYVGILQDNRFLKEIVEVIKNNKKYEFHVGGFGKYESYFKKISKKYDNIYFYGKLDYTQTLNLEYSCDLMVAVYNPKIKNHYYAAPNKFYEALMIGKPLIMARNTGLDYLIKKHDLGEVIDYDIESFKRGLEDVTQRKEEWLEISARMKKLYQKFAWEKMENKLINLYKDL